MPNYVYEVLKLYEEWLNGKELSEEEIWKASRLLGSPTRKLDPLVQRIRDVFSKLVEERCCEASRGRVCIYSWSRRAYKRYFPVALDAAGTVIWYPEPGVTRLISYPLHRALELGVHGVKLPEDDPAFVVPRLDGWQVNLYYDLMLSRWLFSTKYVLHNMMFRRGRLLVEEYGEYVNPLASTAHAIAVSRNLYQRMEDYREWTLTLMVVGELPAAAQKRLPEPEEADSYRLVLIAARDPSGKLHDPIESAGIAEKLGLESVAELVARGISRDEAIKAAEEDTSYPSSFLWYPSRGDKEHPEHYEAKSRYYEDYIMAVYGRSAKPLVVLLTSGSKRVEEELKASLGGVVDDVKAALDELGEVLKEVVDSEVLEKVLREIGAPRKLVSSAIKALEEGKTSRALRIIAASILEGLGVGEAAYILESLASRIRALQG